MSRCFIQTVMMYLSQSRKAAPASLLILASNQFSMELNRLPLGVVFEPMRTPIHNIHSVSELFAIPEEDRFYTCLVSGCDQRDLHPR